MLTTGVCLVGIGVTLAYIEPRALDWLKLRLVEVVGAPARSAQAVVSVVGDTVSATAGRLNLWRAPVAVFALVAGVLIFLLRRL